MKRSGNLWERNKNITNLSMDKHPEESLREKYNNLYPRYKKLAFNLKQALEIFLEEDKITYLSISSRIKEFEFFAEKITRKDYKNPFKEVEDLCGIRIICYYQSNVKKIADIIQKEFEIVESQDKEDSLNSDQFGYRSVHFIVKIKQNWLNAPNYRGLENLKAEIQVRTVLMHAWAEIEHKLAYKKKTHIPDQFRRKFSRLSAKLEEADEQFEELRQKIREYKKGIIEQAKSKEGIFNKNLPLNLDNLQAFLDYYFPDNDKNIDLTRGLLDELLAHKVTVKSLVESYLKVKEYLPKIEKELFDIYKVYLLSQSNWSQTGVVRIILDLTNDSYFNCRAEGLPPESDYEAVVLRWREILLNDDSNKKSKN